MNATQCPSDEWLADFLFGRTPAAELDLVDAHVAECNKCQATLEMLEGRRDSLVEELRRPAAPNSFEKEPQLDEALVRAREVVHAAGLTGGGAPPDPALTPPLAGSADATDEPPERIGPYRIEKLLGKGGFGAVYLGYDERAQRTVAIKLSHRLADHSQDGRLAEARAQASLDHPHIVPVYYVDETEDGGVYIVSKFIDGREDARDLARLIGTQRPPHDQSADIVASLAEALQHAHSRGVTHRDIKPANILLDSAGKPYLADFGLALQDPNVAGAAPGGGTPYYMSPEQVSGQADRVDGRSDVFSLGAVFYELLTGARPFQADNRVLLAEQITTSDPRPPRQRDETIPEELERICRKCLEKDLDTRYTSAADLARDLRQWLTSPRFRRRPFPVGAWTLTVAVALLLALSLGAPLWNSSPRPAPNGNAVPPRDAAPLAELQFDLHFQRKHQSGSYELLTADALPLYSGDRVQIHATLPRPMYAALIAASARDVAVLYPPPDDPSLGATPAGELHFPPGRDEWLPLEPPGGTETLILLASEEALPDSHTLRRQMLAFGHPPRLDEVGLLIADGRGARLYRPGDVSRAFAKRTVESPKGFIDLLVEDATSRGDRVSILAFPHQSTP